MAELKQMACLWKGNPTLVCGPKPERIEAKRKRQTNQPQRQTDLLSFSPLMRQEGQEEPRAHAQSPRPVPNPAPFPNPRRLATPIYLRLREKMGGGKRCTESSMTKGPGIPSEPGM